ncbi:hypothetical protein MKW98_021933 [Papaver atlanticum]|uniref:Uncharacterized protein n=1 Tax=Papaver atlanticum TaxID=357466 RepID=A0AAD4Y0C4_9MAGN|nr:hypothetical protein MKW98_021933 [Papaver atlanticum]
MSRVEINSSSEDMCNADRKRQHRRVKVKKKEKSKLAIEWWREANSTGGGQEDEIIGAEMKLTEQLIDPA